MSIPIEVPNPYAANAADINGRFSVSRPEISAWVEAAIDENAPLLHIYSAEQLGKTTLLHQLYDKWSGEGKTAVFIQSNTLSAPSVSTLLHTISQFIIEQLPADIASLIPIQTETKFTANPFATFATQLNEIAQHNLSKVHILIDDFDKIWRKASSNKQFINFLNHLQQTQQFSNKLTLLFTTHTDVAAFEFPQRQLPPFSLTETSQFVQLPVHYTIVDEVIQLIHAQTGGQPAALRHMCQQIFAHYQKTNFRQLTLADLMLLLKKSPNTQQADNHKLQDWFTELSTQTLQQVSKREPLPRNFQLFGAVSAVALIALLLLLGGNRFGRGNVSAGSATPEVAVSSLDEPTETAVSPTQTATTPPESSPAPTETAVLPTLTPTVTVAAPTASPTPATPTATATSPPFSLSAVITRTSDNMPMHLVPNGTFLMGSVEGEFLSNFDEIPQREVTISQFYIDRYEVTVAQYAAFLNRLGGYQSVCSFNDCTLPRSVIGYTSYLEEQDLGDGSSQFSPLVGFANYPVNHVSWYGAFSYCQAMGARLPTEAEWEYAARGEDGRLYPWGNDPPNATVAVFNSESYDNLKPVDALPDGTSPFGIYNMSGSMWEWTNDWYAETYYQSAPDVDPQGPETGLTRTARGGAWPFNNQAERLRSANRNHFAPDFISSTIGFRCAMTP